MMDINKIIILEYTEISYKLSNPTSRRSLFLGQLSDMLGTRVKLKRRCPRYQNSR